MKEAASTDKKYSGAKWSVLFFAGIILLWQLLIPMFGVPDYLMPTPWRVVEEFGKRGWVILYHLVPTFEVTILGFLIGAVVGIFSGIGIVYSHFLWLTVYPALVLVSSVPRIAIAPLILIWFGIDSLLSKVIISFLVAFFPMLINSVVGLSQVSPDMIDLGKTMGMSRLDEFKKIRLPNSVPFLFAGFKASIALAVIGAPDDDLLSAVLLKQMADRQIMPSPETVAYLTARMERSFAAVQAIAEALDRASLAQKRAVTLALARQVLDGMNAPRNV